MNEMVSLDANRATFIEADSGRATGQILPKTWFAELVQALWPVKGAVAVAQYAGCPDRTARNYQGGHSEPPASVLRDLLRGNEGYRVLTFVMRDHDPTWWVTVQHHRNVYDALQAAAPTLRGIINACQ